MGCNRTVTKRDFEQISATADCLKAPVSSINKKAIETAMHYYDEDIVVELVDFYSDAPDYVNAVVELLNTVAETGITGMDEVLIDLCKSGRKAAGAEYQLTYVMSHLDEIAEVSVPRAMERKDRSIYAIEGIDILNKDGSVVELKNYDFSSDFYRSGAKLVAERAVRQAKDRVENLGAPSVMIVFAGWNGHMPDKLAAALQEEIGGNGRISWDVQ